MKVLTVVGARPQFVKAATVARVIRQRDDMRELLIHTGQHYDANMSRVFFSDLEIPEPDRNLGIGSGPHGKQTGRMLQAIEDTLLQERPDWVLVYGDTNSTLAGALAAVKLHIPVAHVEAGLRSFNRAMPEEINRVLTDHIATLLFAPTDTAAKNLHNEGISADRIKQVGDVMYDAALFYGKRAQRASRVLEMQGLTSKDYILATIHRAENTGNESRLRQVFDGLVAAAEHSELVLPLHPRTRDALTEFGLLERYQARLKFIEPVGYLDMVMLEQHARVIVTDSGGVQKEAYFHRVPCITYRDETEWEELVQLGCNRLVGTEDMLRQALEAFTMGEECDWDAPVYGQGDASYRIVDVLANAG